MRRNLLQIIVNGLMTVAIVSLFWAFNGAQADGDLISNETDTTANVSQIISTDFTYQGYLEKSGIAVTDSCDMRFTFYSVVTGGTAIGTAQTRNNISVDDGTFAVELAAGTLFQNEASYIEIAVDCGGGLITLSPRQEITAAPYAHTLRPGATINGVSVSALNLTVNAASGADGLRVDSTGGDDGMQIVGGDDAIYITAAGDDAIQIEGAEGDGVFVNDADGIGVSVDSAKQHGVRSVTSSNAHYGGAFINEGATDVDGVGLYARGNNGNAPDLVLGGNSSSGGGDDGVISSDPAYPDSDLYIESNDAVIVRLDRDADGDDADFFVEDNAGKNLFNIDESGDIWADYNGTLDYAVPYAMAYVDDDGTLFHGTETVEATSWVTSFSLYRVDLAIACDDVPYPRPLVIMVTPEKNELQAGANSIECNNGKVSLRVYFENNLGFNQATDFHLLVYRLRN